MLRRTRDLGWAGVVALCAIGAWAIDAAGPSAHVGPPGLAAEAGRIVSLSPAMTETLFAIGAGERVIAVDAHCTHPADTERLTKVGTAFAPAYEAIASLDADLVVTEPVGASGAEALARLAPVLAVPWLSIDEVISGIRELGRRADRADEARSLAGRFEAVRDAAARPNDDGPRTLLVFAHEPGRLQQAYFMKEDSLHGTLLAAAGARNAIPGEFVGSPALSLERVVEAAPEVVVILVPEANPAATRLAALVADWQELDIPAADSRRIHTLVGAHIYIPGPRILGLVDTLRQWTDGQRASRAGGGPRVAAF